MTNWSPVQVDVPHADDDLWSDDLGRYLTHDEAMLLVADEVPGFAGFTVDDTEERLGVMLTDVSDPVVVEGAEQDEVVEDRLPAVEHLDDVMRRVLPEIPTTLLSWSWPTTT